MKQLTITLFILLLISSCQQTADKNQMMQEEAAKHKGSYSNITLSNSFDFICNMDLEMGVSDTAHYQGEIYGFCCRICKQEFKSNPEISLKNKKE